MLVMVNAKNCDCRSAYHHGGLVGHGKNMEEESIGSHLRIPPTSTNKEAIYLTASLGPSMVAIKYGFDFAELLCG